MPIQVTCPGCLKRFTVADKHAGKQGPCPACKKPITIPKLEEEKPKAVRVNVRTVNEVANESKVIEAAEASE